MAEPAVVEAEVPTAGEQTTAFFRTIIWREAGMFYAIQSSEHEALEGYEVTRRYRTAL